MKKFILIPAIIIATLGYQGISLNEQLVDLQTEFTTLQETNTRLQEEKLSLIDETIWLQGCLDAYREASESVYDKDIPLSEALQRHVYATSQYYNIDPRLVLATISIESRFDASAVSSTDDYGLMQINKCNHEVLSETLGVDDFLDPYQNIEAGTYMLSSLVHKYKSYDKALMAYNMGESGAAVHWKQGKTTSSYSESILQKYNEYIRIK